MLLVATSGTLEMIFQTKARSYHQLIRESKTAAAVSVMLLVSRQTLLLPELLAAFRTVIINSTKQLKCTIRIKVAVTLHRSCSRLKQEDNNRENMGSSCDNNDDATTTARMQCVLIQ